MDGIKHQCWLALSFPPLRYPKSANENVECCSDQGLTRFTRSLANWDKVSQYDLGPAPRA